MRATLPRGATATPLRPWGTRKSMLPSHPMPVPSAYSHGRGRPTEVSGTGSGGTVGSGRVWAPSGPVLSTSRPIAAQRSGDPVLKGASLVHHHRAEEGARVADRLGHLPAGGQHPREQVLGVEGWVDDVAVDVAGVPAPPSASMAGSHAPRQALRADHDRQGEP